MNNKNKNNSDLGLKPNNYEYYKIQKSFLSDESLSNENYLKTRITNPFEVDTVTFGTNIVQHYLNYKEQTENQLLYYHEILEKKIEESFCLRAENDKNEREKQAIKEYASKLKEENLKLIEIIKGKDAELKQEREMRQQLEMQATTQIVEPPKVVDTKNMKGIKKFRSEQSLFSRSSHKSMWKYSKKSRSDSTIRVYDECKFNESRLGSTQAQLEETLITNNTAFGSTSVFREKNGEEDDDDYFVINKSKYSNVGKYIKKITGSVFKSKGVETKRGTKPKRLNNANRGLFGRKITES